MDISTVGSAASSGAAVGGNVDLASTFNNFLLLLTTQLQYQDPLSPLDTNQFTEQLVQFTNVEQSIKTNSKLDQLIALQGANQLTAALDYIGKTVDVDS
ncbi:MAG: flagellar hook assembly protein FlgD, partial [Planctomycetota bacterium]